MELQTWLVTILVILLLLAVAGLTFLFIWLTKNLLKALSQTQKNQENLVETILTHQTNSTNSLETLLDKTVSLLSSKDPITFQQIQAMNSVSEMQEPQDNSDYAETMRWVEQENPGLTDHEKELIRANYNGEL